MLWLKRPRLQTPKRRIEQENIHFLRRTVQTETNGGLDVRVPLRPAIRPNPAIFGDLSRRPLAKGFAVEEFLGLLVCQVAGQTPGLFRRQRRRWPDSALGNQMPSHSLTFWRIIIGFQARCSLLPCTLIRSSCSPPRRPHRVVTKPAYRHDAQEHQAQGRQPYTSAYAKKAISFVSLFNSASHTCECRLKRSLLQAVPGPAPARSDTRSFMTPNVSSLIKEKNRPRLLRIIDAKSSCRSGERPEPLKNPGDATDPRSPLPL